MPATLPAHPFDPAFELGLDAKSDLRPYPFESDLRLLARVPFWFPVLDHPNAGGPPWYTVDPAGHVCRTDNHPRGATTTPTFRLVGDVAYSTGYGTEGGAGIPWFRVVGAMVYPASGHPLGEVHIARYQMRDR